MAAPGLPISSTLAAVRDHARHFRDFEFVYPVISRRSGGLSIGVNLNPDKRCNFDCVYCEVDRSLPGNASKPDLGQIRAELAEMIRFVRQGRLAGEPKFDEAPALARAIRDIAFSGDGEPTLVDNFDECARVVAEVKAEQQLDATKIVLITNAAGLNKTAVRRGLQIMDRNQGELWAKLDAGTPAYFKQLNRSSVSFDRILSNIVTTARVRPVVIQSLFVKIRGERLPALELEAFCQRLRQICANGGQIRIVHAYTLARPVPNDGVEKLSRAELDEIAGAIRRQTALPVAAFD